MFTIIISKHLIFVVQSLLIIQFNFMLKQLTKDEPIDVLKFCLYQDHIFLHFLKFREKYNHP